jgi:subtilisin family serine protease
VYHPDIQANIWTNPGETGQDASGAEKEGNGIDDDRNGYIDDWQGYDFSDNDNDPMDYDGHGTHVAGTVAARGNNGQGISGVMWQAQVMALKMFPNSVSNVAAAAIKYAANNGARAANYSWGAYGSSAAVKDAIEYALQRNMLSIAAAGNDGVEGILYPAAPRRKQG